MVRRDGHVVYANQLNADGKWATSQESRDRRSSWSATDPGASQRRIATRTQCRGRLSSSGATSIDLHKPWRRGGDHQLACARWSIRPVALRPRRGGNRGASGPRRCSVGASGGWDEQRAPAECGAETSAAPTGRDGCLRHQMHRWITSGIPEAARLTRRGDAPIEPTWRRPRGRPPAAPPLSLPSQFLSPSRLVPVVRLPHARTSPALAARPVRSRPSRPPRGSCLAGRPFRGTTVAAGRAESCSFVPAWSNNHAGAVLAEADVFYGRQPARRS